MPAVLLLLWLVEVVVCLLCCHPFALPVLPNTCYPHGVYIYGVASFFMSRIIDVIYCWGLHPPSLLWPLPSSPLSLPRLPVRSPEDWLPPIAVDQAARL